MRSRHKRLIIRLVALKKEKKKTEGIIVTVPEVKKDLKINTEFKLL